MVFFASAQYSGSDRVWLLTLGKTRDKGTGAIPITRLANNPIPSGTTKANKAVYAALECSTANPKPVWCNYQLIGTQFKGVSAPAGVDVVPAGNALLTQDGQAFYLSNLVLETNVGLQNFQGTPPMKTFVLQWAAGVNAVTAGNKSTTKPDVYIVDKTPSTFQRGYSNLAFGRTAHNMGGCMGCHGVAQLQGYSFSFVLQKGQGGAKPETGAP